MARKILFIVVMLSASWCASSYGGVIVHHQTASFVSDLQPNQFLVFPTFDNQGGTLILNDVRVDVQHRAAVTLRADNDDRYKNARVNGRMIRLWTLTAPDIFASGNKIVTTSVVDLSFDDGDGRFLDSSPADGTEFFGPINYAEFAGLFHPSHAPYETNGAGTVTFVADVLLMVNDLQFINQPDSWQLEVQRPSLNIDVTLTYTFSVVPLPPAMWLALFGLATTGWIARRVA